MRRSVINSTPKSFALILVLAVCSLLLAACPKDKQQAQSQARTLVTIADEAAKNTKRAVELTDQLFEAKAIEAATSERLTLGLLKVRNANKAFIEQLKTYIKKDASGKDVIELPTDARAALNPLAVNVRNAITQLIGDGTLGIKNPTERAKYQFAVTSLTALLQAIGGFGGI